MFLLFSFSVCLPVDLLSSFGAFFLLSDGSWSRVLDCGGIEVAGHRSCLQDFEDLEGKVVDPSKIKEPFLHVLRSRKPSLWMSIDRDLPSLSRNKEKSKKAKVRTEPALN